MGHILPAPPTEYQWAVAASTLSETDFALLLDFAEALAWWLVGTN